MQKVFFAPGFTPFTGQDMLRYAKICIKGSFTGQCETVGNTRDIKI